MKFLKYFVLVATTLSLPVAGAEESFKDAVALWHFADIQDAAGNHGLKTHGAVTLGGATRRPGRG